MKDPQLEADEQMIGKFIARKSRKRKSGMPSDCRSTLFALRAPSRRIHLLFLFVVISLLSVIASQAAAQGNAKQGARAIRNQCLPCHSLEAGRHMTGPSLAGIIGKKAGSAKDFDRYSEALQESEIIWSKDTLYAFLTNPQRLIPKNTMTALVDDPKIRADIVAYLEVTQNQEKPSASTMPVPFQQTLDLRSVGRASRVAKIALCRDTYSVTLENGATQKIWERNLRFKTDGSKEGPLPGKPTLIPSGQYGDRFYIIFAVPKEISQTIEAECEN